MLLSLLASSKRGRAHAVTVHAAKTDLSKLIEAALRGEEVIIAPGDKPVVSADREADVRHGITADRLKGPIPDIVEPTAEADQVIDSADIVLVSPVSHDEVAREGQLGRRLEIAPFVGTVLNELDRKAAISHRSNLSSA